LHTCVNHWVVVDFNNAHSELNTPRPASSFFVFFFSPPPTRIISSIRGAFVGKTFQTSTTRNVGIDFALLVCLYIIVSSTVHLKLQSVANEHVAVCVSLLWWVSSQTRRKYYFFCVLSLKNTLANHTFISEMEVPPQAPPPVVGEHSALETATATSNVQQPSSGKDIPVTICVRLMN
jgi:hypothetical protein